MANQMKLITELFDINFAKYKQISSNTELEESVVNSINNKLGLFLLPNRQNSDLSECVTNTIKREQTEEFCGEQRNETCDSSDTSIIANSISETFSINSIKNVEQYVERVETGGKKYYVCKTCKYVSNKCGNMVKHVRTHTGEKPFCCEICGKQFSDPSTLRKHRIRHNENKIKQLCHNNVITCNKITVIKPIIEQNRSEREPNGMRFATEIYSNLIKKNNLLSKKRTKRLKIEKFARVNHINEANRCE